MQKATFKHNNGGIYDINDIINSNYISNVQKAELIDSLNHFTVLSSEMLHRLETLGWSYNNPFTVWQDIITFKGSKEKIIHLEKYWLVTKNCNEENNCLPETRLSNITFDKVDAILNT